MNLHSNSLHGRFVRAMVVASMALGVVAVLLVYQAAKRHLLQEGRANVQALVSAVAPTAAVGAYAKDKLLLGEIAQGLLRHPHVAMVQALDVDGSSFLAPAAPLQGGPNPGAVRPAGGVAPQPSFDYVLHSPFDAEETIGQLQVWVDEDRLARNAQTQAELLVAAMTAVLIVSLLLFNALAHRLLSQPMHHLADALSTLHPGSDQRLPIAKRHQGDEVGIVIQAANRLLDLQQQALSRERGMRDEIAAMEAHYRGIFDSTSAGLFIMSPQGSLLQANPALTELLGSEALADRDRFAEQAFRDSSALFAAIAIARQRGEPEDLDLELQHQTSGIQWVHCLVSVIVREQERQELVEGVLYDITGRKLREAAALHRAEHDSLTGLKNRASIEVALGQRVQAARHADGAVTLMFIDLDGFKVVNDRWGHVAGDAVLVEAARRLHALFRRSGDIVGRLGGDELVVVMEGSHARDPIVRGLAQQLIQSFQVPFVLPNAEAAQVGASVGVASYPHNANSAATLIEAADAAMYAAKQAGKGVVVIAEAAVTGLAPHVAAPITQEWQAAQARTAMQDPLTGLPDRRVLIGRLARAHARARWSGKPAAVLCVDLDQFKTINVARGTQAGDAVLREASRRMATLLRGDDTLARTGSDEFVMVVGDMAHCEDEAVVAAMNLARSLLELIAQPIVLSDGGLSVRASAGLSLLKPGTRDPQAVLHEAQLAVRRAKAEERGGVAMFESDMMAKLQERLALEGDLRQAVHRGEFVLEVQPQVDSQRQVIGGEALLRWQHPQRGWLSPITFIGLAESSGQIVDIGRWVLQEGCRLLAAMQRTAGYSLSINVSPAQFQHPDFVADVRDALAMTGAPAHAVVLEITENLLIANLEAVRARMRELVDLGLRFSIDDFGTGFSSLGYLRSLPLHEIKIDRSFIAGLPHDSASVGIVQSILSMGHHLGLHVVAEGVETEDQCEFLNRHGCHAQQGWLHGRPRALTLHPSRI